MRRDAAPTDRDNFADTEGVNDEIVTVAIGRRNLQAHLTLQNSGFERRGRCGTGFAI